MVAKLLNQKSLHNRFEICFYLIFIQTILNKHIDSEKNLKNPNKPLLSTVIDKHKHTNSCQMHMKIIWVFYNVAASLFLNISVNHTVLIVLSACACTSKKQSSPRDSHELSNNKLESKLIRVLQERNSRGFIESTPGFTWRSIMPKTNRTHYTNLPLKHFNNIWGVIVTIWNKIHLSATCMAICNESSGFFHCFGINKYFLIKNVVRRPKVAPKKMSR